MIEIITCLPNAEEEMLDDDLEHIDIENAILKGRLEKRLTRDVRGTRYALKVQRWMADWCMSFVGFVRNKIRLLSRFMLCR